MKTNLIIFTILLTTFEVTSADGKFYHEKLIPWIPGQRALLLYDEKEEILLLQSSYESESGSFGWVVPLPDVPELASMKSEEAEWIFDELSDLSAADFTDLSGVKFLITLALFISALVVVNVYLSGALRVLLDVLLAVFVLVFILVFPRFVSRELNVGVSVIKSEKIGIYDVEVIKSDNSRMLLEWLNQHKFQFGKDDIRALDYYVKQNWCFVVALIEEITAKQQDIIDTRGSHALMVDPLIVRFKTKSPVYPLALTAATKRNTYLDVFVLTSRKMESKGVIEVTFAGEIDNSILDNLRKNSNTAELLNSFELKGQRHFLTRFSGNLSAAEMSKDLYLENAKDNKSYRKRVIIW